MATSRPGKVVSSRAVHRLLDKWALRHMLSSITVVYHMGHTLQEMGFTLRSLQLPPQDGNNAQVCLTPLLRSFLVERGCTTMSSWTFLHPQAGPHVLVGSHDAVSRGGLKEALADCVAESTERHGTTHVSHHAVVIVVGRPLPHPARA